MHADRHTSRGVYTMFWTLTVFMISNLRQTKLKPIWLKSLNYMYFCIVILNIASKLFIQ